MKKKVLLMAALLSIAMPGWCDHRQNYDYSTTVSSGQTLYFKCNYNANVATIVAPDLEYGSWWESQDATWYGYTKPTGNLEIPLTIDVNGDFLYVTGIEHGAFSDCNALTSVTFSSGLNIMVTIGDRAFYGCSALTSLNLGDRVDSIGLDAFNSCGLTSVTIHNSVTFIGPRAFAACPDLTHIFVWNNNSVYDSRDNCNAIIETSSNTLIVGCKNSIIPNSITTIGQFAFWNCGELASIHIPNSVTSIDSGAFSYCSGLTTPNTYW